MSFAVCVTFFTHAQRRSEAFGLLVVVVVVVVVVVAVVVVVVVVVGGGGGGGVIVVVYIIYIGNPNSTRYNYKETRTKANIKWT